MKPVAVNFHICKTCNDACRFCFATFEDVRDHISVDDAIRVLCLLMRTAFPLLFSGGKAMPKALTMNQVPLKHVEITGVFAELYVDQRRAP